MGGGGWVVNVQSFVSPVNEASGFIKCRDLLNRLSGCYIFKRNSVSMIYLVNEWNSKSKLSINSPCRIVYVPAIFHTLLYCLMILCSPSRQRSSFEKHDVAMQNTTTKNVTTVTIYSRLIRQNTLSQVNFS